MREEGSPRGMAQQGACNCVVQVGASNESFSTLSINNGSDGAGRTALRELQLQVIDEYGNSASCASGEAQVWLQAYDMECNMMLCSPLYLCILYMTLAKCRLLQPPVRLEHTA